MCNSRLYRVNTKVGLRLNGGFLDVALWFSHNEIWHAVRSEDKVHCGYVLERWYCECLYFCQACSLLYQWTVLRFKVKKAQIERSHHNVDCTAQQVDTLCVLQIKQTFSLRYVNSIHTPIAISEIYNGYQRNPHNRNISGLWLARSNNL